MPGWITEDADGRKVSVIVNGSDEEVLATETFVGAVQRLAADRGLQSYKVTVGGRDVGPGTAPHTVGDAGGQIEILPYQKAGL